MARGFVFLSADQLLSLQLVFHCYSILSVGQTGFSIPYTC